MLLFSVILGASIATFCSAQVAYSRVLPYDARYLFRRVPVRRSIDTEYQRIPLPISRNFPQVDMQMAPAPYIAAEPVAYRLSNGEVYAIPNIWSDDEPRVADRTEDEADYDGFDEFENEYGPVYARPASTYPVGEVYTSPQDENEVENPEDIYNDLVVNYLLGEQPMAREQVINVDRRSQEIDQQQQQQQQPSANNVIPEKKNETTEQVTPTTAAVAAAKESPSSAGPASSNAVAVPSSTSTPTMPQKIAAPMSRIHKSEEQSPASKISVQQGLWRNFDDDERGQKEIPLFRPYNVAGKRQAMTALQEQLSRAKTSVVNKDAFPILEKLMAGHRSRDPLTEQLDNLKFRNM